MRDPELLTAAQRWQQWDEQGLVNDARLWQRASYLLLALIVAFAVALGMWMLG